MAGKPGRSGGSRPNTGGARPGAGRKPTPPTFMEVAHTDDPLTFLRLVMANDNADMKLRLDAAKAMMPFLHNRADTAKKPQAEAAAKKASSGKFGPSAAPLRVVS